MTSDKTIGKTDQCAVVVGGGEAGSSGEDNIDFSLILCHQAAGLSSRQNIACGSTNERKKAWIKKGR